MLGYYSYTRGRLLILTVSRLAKNDRINFKTHINTSDATNTIVSLLIELDL